MKNNRHHLLDSPKQLRRLNIGMALALLCILTLSSFVLWSRAASLSNKKDVISNQTTNGTASHQISFNLSSSNDFISGETIEIDFPASFSQSGTWAPGDFTFTDGTARVIYSVTPSATPTPDCVGSAGNDDVAITVDTDDLIFGVTSCGTYTASATGAFITFNIDGTAGSGILTNPGTAGSYVIDVLDGAGDCGLAADSCSMAVAIVDSNDVIVTATVASLCGNGILDPGEQCDPPNGTTCSATCQTIGGGGGGPPPDTTPPVISGIVVSNITASSATVSWTTNEAATSLVRYGLTSSYGSTSSQGAFITSHSRNLTGLAENTTYHYQVCSTDSAGNQACSTDGTFTTLDTTPPNISNVAVSSITTTTATVTWTTNENANSFVDYGTAAGPPYSSTTSDAAFVTSHTINLSGLTPATTYHYRVRSADPSANESFTVDATFTTASPPDATPPVISNIQVINITQTGATVTWTTNEAADSKVDYGTVAGPPYANTTTDGTLVTSHSVNLTGLTASTQYHYRVRSADAALNEASSTNATFTTLAPPDTTAPVISNVQVINITSSGATVTWTTDEQATRFVDYGTSAGPPYSNTAGTATPLQTSHSVVLSGLSNGTQYHYRVRSADAASNEATTSNATFTTLDTVAPVISNVQVVDITTTGARITWTTNEAADSRVEYDIDAGTPYANNQSNATLVTSHSITLSGLTGNTQYHYRVMSKDASNNQAATGNATFTTLTPPDTTAPVISNIQVVDITATGARITWTTNEAADSRVEYGLVAGPPYSNNQSSATLVTSHSVTITGLTQNTTYNYRVMSKDAANNQAASSNATFKTLDTTAPAISNVQVINITETSATVTWTTNEPADSKVDYGTAAGPPYPSTASDGSMVTSHSVNLTGLTLGTTYHYRVRSADPEANETATTNATFTTVDATAPVISNVQAINITQSGARITWTTNENSDSVVEYGPTISYGSTETVATPVTSHQVDITGLNADTTYNFRVKSKDASNNTATSGNFTFKTLKPPAPVISNIQVTAITQTTATVSWTTDILADSKVDYGITTSYGSTRSDGTPKTSHSLNLTGLSKNTTYQFRVRSMDSYAQETSSSNQTFSTLQDVTPPANVSGFTASPGNQSVSLNWTNPSDPDFVRTTIVRKEGSQPTGPSDGTQIYNGTGTSYVDSGLTNGITYHYGAFAYDDVPNYASGAFASATPAGPADFTPPPDITNFLATQGDQQITLTWSIPNDPDWIGVKIQRKTSEYPTSNVDGTTVYNGSGSADLDTGLTNGVTYFYRAFSYDGALNYSSGADVTGTPQAPFDSTPPGMVTNFVANAGDAEVQLTWTNPSDPDWAGTRIVRKTGSQPTGPSDGTVIFEGAGDNRLDIGLTNGTTYYYGAFAYDPSLNFADGAFAQATPEEGAAPPPPPACVDSDGGKNYVVRGEVTEGSNIYQDQCVDAGTVLEYFCSASVGESEQYSCGAGFKCSAGRCVADTQQPELEVCGNGICAGAENSISCSADCPIAPTQPEVEEQVPTVTETERLRVGDLKFFATKARLELRVANASLQVYTRMAVIVYLPDASIRKPIASAFVNYGGSSYPMLQTRSYEATITSSTEPGTQQLTVIVNYQDGTNDSVTVSVNTVARGRVFETVDGEQLEVANATVTLLVDQGGSYGVWDGSASGQNNPLITDDIGRYNFIVSPGTYRLRAEKEGYITKDTLPFRMEGDNVITTSLYLIKQPENFQEAVVAAGQVSAEQVREVIQNPIVEEQTRTIAAPAAAAVAVANVASAGAATATAVPYLLYLYSFLAQPTLLIARRRRKKWGVVFDAITKEAVDLAIVRLTDATTGRIVRSMVTDKEGRYFFIAQKGEYKITVAKNGFIFPTVYMKGQKEGAKYADIYHGEVIQVTEETTITANIPIDPVEKEKTPRRVLWEGILRRFQKSIGLISIGAMAIAIVITPTPLVIAMFFGNILMYIGFRRIAVGKRPKNWGIVYDETTKKPLRNAIVRIFEAKYNKLLETQVTDIRGRYAFLVGNNVYYVTYEKPGYQKQQKGPVDLIEIKDEEKQVIAEDMGLIPGGGKVADDDGSGKGGGSLLVPPSKKNAPASIDKPALGEEVTRRDSAAGEAAVAAGKAASLLVGPSTKPASGSTAPPAPTSTEAPKAGTSKIPWELQALSGGKKEGEPSTKPTANDGVQKTGGRKVAWELQALAGALGAAKETEAPDEKKETTAAATPSAEPAEAPKAGTSKIPWELQALSGGKKGSDAVKPPEPTPAEERPYPDVGKESDIKTHPFPGVSAPSTPLIEDVEHAHPDVKMIQDAEHAHPETKMIDDVDKAHPEVKKLPPKPPEDDGTAGSMNSP